MPNRYSIIDGSAFAFFQRELEHIKAKTYDVLYPAMKFDVAFPVSTECPAGVDRIVSQTYDFQGTAKIMTGNATDLPRVDIDGKESVLPVREIGAKFGYTVREIERASQGGLPLEQKRANACRETIERMINHVAWFGDAPSGLTGFLTPGNGIVTATAPNTGTSSGTKWSTKDEHAILDDVNLAFNTVFEGSKAVEQADRLGLPPKQWAYIMTKKLGQNSDYTIAKWIVENSPWLGGSLENIIAIPEFASSDGSADVMAVWTKNPDKIEVEIPKHVELLSPQPRDLSFEVPARALFAGLNIHYPGSARIFTGI